MNLEGMRTTKRREAEALWEDVQRLAGNCPVPEDWNSLRERIGQIDEARTIYHDQPAIKAIKAGFPDVLSLIHI